MGDRLDLLLITPTDQVRAKQHAGLVGRAI